MGESGRFVRLPSFLRIRSSLSLSLSLPRDPGRSKIFDRKKVGSKFARSFLAGENNKYGKLGSYEYIVARSIS